MTREEFLKAALAAATAARDVGAPVNPVIAAAQAALESNWGQSQLAREANNLKGVKAGSQWGGPVIELPTREWREADGTWYTTVAKWRKYADWTECFDDYGSLINRVYPHAAAVAHDARQFLEQLTARDYPKWATDPRYTEKIWSIVEQHNLLAAAAPERLLLVFDTTGEEIARVPLPEGADVLVRASSDGQRFYVRPDTD